MVEIRALAFGLVSSSKYSIKLGCAADETC